MIEYRRIMDKIARRIRLIAIADIGDRSFNSSPSSTARAQQRYCRPLREMAVNGSVGQLVMPGEIESPKSEDISIVWESKNSVVIYLSAKPKDCPKKITANLMLDLSNPGDI